MLDIGVVPRQVKYRQATLLYTGPSGTALSFSNQYWSLDRLASTYHPITARACVSDGGAGAEHWESAEKKKTPRKDPNALIPLSVPEIRHLLWWLVWQKTVEQSLVLAWSVWRRRHQAQ